MPGPAPSLRGSQSNGTKTRPCAQFIRFTEDENKKLVKFCRKHKLSVQGFGHAAIMKALEDADLGNKSAAEIERENEDTSETTIKGLGIRERLQPRKDKERRDYTPSVAPASTPMQAAPQARVASIDGEVLALARTIVESPESARKEVWKSAIRALARGRTEQEALLLADDLGAAIKRLAGTPQTALERVRARTAGR